MTSETKMALNIESVIIHLLHDEMLLIIHNTLKKVVGLECIPIYKMKLCLSVTTRRRHITNGLHYLLYFSLFY